MYREETGMDCPQIAVADRGKPYFVTGKLHFSISHTGKHVFCALSERPVGLDAEEKDRQINLHLAQKILSEPEKIRFAEAVDKRSALLRLWVLKEAAAKLTGEGLRGYPCHTDFSLEDGRVQQIDSCLVAIMEE
jgi:4'-phosphopantetheinyl transferase